MLVTLNAVGLVAVRLVDLREGYHPAIGVNPYSLPGIWTRWDAGYYIAIARDGYQTHPHMVGFFPLFPLLMRGWSQLTGVHPALAGMLIAQVSYLFALLILYKLARQIRDNHGYAMRTVMGLLLFPTSFFYFAVYAESLYLLLAIAGTYLTLQKDPGYLRAGLAYGLASISRPIGWMLNLILIVAFYLRRRFDWQAWSQLISGLLISGSGVVLYVLSLYKLTGSLLAIPQAQANWGRIWTLPWVTYWESVRTLLFSSHRPSAWFLTSINAVDLAFTSFAIALAIYGLFRARKHAFPWSLAMFLIISLLFLMSRKGKEPVPLDEMARWTAALFPIYLLMAEIGREKTIWRLMLGISGISLLALMAWFATGRWVG